MSMTALEEALQTRFPSCMTGNIVAHVFKNKFFMRMLIQEEQCTSYRIRWDPLVDHCRKLE